MGIMSKLNERFPDGILNKEVRKDMKSMVNNMKNGGRTPTDENGNPIYKTTGRKNLSLKSVETERDLQRMTNVKFVLDKNTAKLKSKKLMYRFLTKSEYGIEAVAIYDTEMLKEVGNDFKKVDELYVISPLIVFSPLYYNKVMYLRQGSDDIDDLLSYEADWKQTANTISNDPIEKQKSEELIKLYAEYNEIIYPLIQEAFDIENKYVANQRVDKVQADYIGEVSEYNDKLHDLKQKKKELDILDKELSKMEKDLADKKTALDSEKAIYLSEVEKHNYNLDLLKDLENQFSLKQNQMELELIKFKTGEIPYLNDNLNNARNDILAQQTMLFNHYNEYLLKAIKNLVSGMLTNVLAYEQNSISDIHYEALKILEKAYPDVQLTDKKINEQLLGTTLEYIEAYTKEELEKTESITKETAEAINNEESVEKIQEAVEEALVDNEDKSVIDIFGSDINNYMNWAKETATVLGIDREMKHTYERITTRLGRVDSTSIIKQSPRDLVYIIATDYYLESEGQLVTAVIGITPFNITVFNSGTTVVGFKYKYEIEADIDLTDAGKKEMNENAVNNYKEVLEEVKANTYLNNEKLKNKQAGKENNAEPEYKQVHSTEAHRWLERVNNLSNLYKKPEAQNLLKLCNVRIAFSSEPIKISPTEVYTEKTFMFISNKGRIFIMHDRVMIGIVGQEKPITFTYETLQELELILKSGHMKTILNNIISCKDKSFDTSKFLLPVVSGLNLKQTHAIEN